MLADESLKRAVIAVGHIAAEELCVGRCGVRSDHRVACGGLAILCQNPSPRVHDFLGAAAGGERGGYGGGDRGGAGPGRRRGARSRARPWLTRKRSWPVYGRPRPRAARRSRGWGGSCKAPIPSSAPVRCFVRAPIGYVTLPRNGDFSSCREKSDRCLLAVVHCRSRVAPGRADHENAWKIKGSQNEPVCNRLFFTPRTPQVHVVSGSSSDVRPRVALPPGTKGVPPPGGVAQMLLRKEGQHGYTRSAARCRGVCRAIGRVFPAGLGFPWPRTRTVPVPPKSR